MVKIKKQKIYVAFIDFHKCFDTINRQILWNILRNNGVKGKLYRAFHSMYKTVKACIKCNNERSDYVVSSVGLKQGCLASTILFSFYIDELQHILDQSDIRGIQLHPFDTQLLSLMFADDIALLSDTITGLQTQLNILSNFCDTYKLTVNECKTKIVVFKNGGALARNEHWSYKDKTLDIVNTFNYVGLTFTRQLSMNIMVQELCNKFKYRSISGQESIGNRPVYDTSEEKYLGPDIGRYSADVCLHIEKLPIDVRSA